jgi:hypothetical protein
MAVLLGQVSGQRLAAMAVGDTEWWPLLVKPDGSLFWHVNRLPPCHADRSEAEWRHLLNRPAKPLLQAIEEAFQIRLSKAGEVDERALCQDSFVNKRLERSHLG